MIRNWPHPSTILLLAAAIAGPAGAMPTAWGQATVRQPAPTPSAVSAAPLPKSTAPVLPAIKDEAENSAPEKKSGSGFKMHGHWIIDVKNPDGTVAEHRDFENALLPTGANYLLGLMGGFYTPGNFMILLGPPVSPTGFLGVAPCISNGSQTGCGMVTATSTYPGLTYCASTLCATGLTLYKVPSSTSTAGVVTPGSLAIIGAITANQAGVLGQVVTFYSACPALISPVPPTAPATETATACQADTTASVIVGALSSKTLETVMNVSLGQIIQVMVIITFS